MHVRMCVNMCVYVCIARCAYVCICVGSTLCRRTLARASSTWAASAHNLMLLSICKLEIWNKKSSVSGSNFAEKGISEAGAPSIRATIKRKIWED